MTSLKIYTLIVLSFITACSQSKNTKDKHLIVENVESKKPVEDQNEYTSVHDTAFVIMNKYASGFSYDMKYATDDNFLNKTVYSCDDCLIRKAVADALKRANTQLIAQGFRIKFYDCYRPVAVQHQMWEIYPNAKYVANPNTTGSIHNRGGAVDITLVDLDGHELNMGTSFDHFGKEAHHAYTNLPDTVLANRRLLKKTMEAHGFKPITSEWWHYNFKLARNYALSDFSVKCD